jgi:hypothetical protein
MATRFFANLSIVIGVFVCIGGGCAMLLGFFEGGPAAMGGLISLVVGIGLIIYGAGEKKSGR